MTIKTYNAQILWSFFAAAFSHHVNVLSVWNASTTLFRYKLQ